MAGEGAPASVSVIVTTYNDARFLCDSLDSVLAQSHAAAEVILIDDGSDQAASDELSRLVANYPSVRLVRVDHGGLAAARNHGLRLATSQYIAFLDADDVWLPGALAGNAACFVDNPGAGLVYGAHAIVDAGLRLTDGPFLARTGPLAYHALLRENVIGMHGAVMYDRSKLSEIGGFDPALQYCEDYDVYLKLSRKYRIASHGGLVAHYRLHGQNMSSDTVGMLDCTSRVLDRHRPAQNDPRALAAWKEGKQALPRAFANLAWKSRGAGETQRLAERKKLLRIAPRSSVIAALRQFGVRILPDRAIRLARWIRQRSKDRQNGLVDFGDLARLRPLDPYFGFGRGQPIDRFYIEDFLVRHAQAITGRVLEVGDAQYSQRFGQGITRQDVLNFGPGHPATTIVGDLVDEKTLDRDVFDCIIATQVLPFIYDIKAAIAALHRGLRPGGAALVTVPGISADAETEWDFYWSLTEKSATRLFADAFGAENVEVTVAGNVFSASCFLYGIAVEDVGEGWLEPADPDYPVIISIIARKPA